MNEYDLVVIGAGTGGLVSAFVGDALGARVLLVERERVGGECLWSGCVPSKTLIQSARVFDLVKNCEEYGVHAEKPRLIWNAVRLRLQDVRDDIRRLEREQLSKSSLEIALGDATFIDAHLLGIASKSGTRRVRARKVILATGSESVIPNVPGLRESGFLTHREIFDLRSLPRSLAIVGGGASGCEFAQCFARLGSRVTLIARGALLGREDADVSAQARQILENSGVQVLAPATLLGVRSDDDGKYLRVRSNGEESEIRATQILVAAGKAPRVHGMGLENAGVAFSESGVQTDKYLRTGAPHIFAVGDVRGKNLWTHAAEHEAKTAARNALLPAPAALDERAMPSSVFLEPPVASVGMTEAEARRKLRGVGVLREDFKTLDRAIIDGEAQAFCKLVTSRSGRILGAHIVGPGAPEMLPLLTHAVREGMLAAELAELVFAYPTLSEILHRAGNGWYRKQLAHPALKPLLRFFARRV
jgi:pyruvate/2-oxoglutarate dehydrogenase complex dihydrolipoamide dehydrogenase (E3) component